MSKCGNCRLRKESAKAFDIHWHGKEDCPYDVCPEIKTNADRIRAMTDEELAQFIDMIHRNGHTGTHPDCTWLDWLREDWWNEPYKEEDDG